MPALRRRTTPLKPTQRSRVTNGRALFVTGTGGDGRNPWSRRFRDIINLHVADLGGDDNCSAAEHSIIRRIATLTVELERLEAKFAVGEGDDKLDIYQRASSSQRRLLESIGLQRRSRDVQTLEQYVAETYPDQDDTDQDRDSDDGPKPSIKRYRPAETPSESSEPEPAGHLARAADPPLPEIPTAIESPSRSGGSPP